MTAYAGTIQDPPVAADPASLYSSNLAALGQYTFPPASFDGVQRIYSLVRTAHLPTGEFPVHFGGDIQPVFFDDWYNHIHILPGAIALGNLLSNQTRNIEVWNAYFVPEVLNSITSVGGTGLVLNQPGTPPLTYGILEAKQYTLQISTIGPAVVNAVFSFNFAVEVANLTVTGVRTTIFSMLPDWTQPIQERIEYLTDVLTSRAGYEQRIQLRQVPRISYQFTTLAYEDDYQYLDTLLSSWQSRVYALPIWTDQQFLQNPLAQGSNTVVLGDLTGLDFQVGGVAIIGTDARHNEGTQILSITVVGALTTIQFQKGVDNAWPAGAYIVPGRSAVLSQNQRVTRATAKLGVAPLQWTLVENHIDTAVSTARQYKGLDVYLIAPDRATDVTVDYTRLTTVLDYKIGPILYEDIPQRTFDIRSYSYLYGSRAEILAFKQFLAKRLGQLTPFYMPTWERNFEVKEVVGASDTQVAVQSQGFSVLFNPLVGGRDAVAFLHNNGTWYFFDIIGFSATANPEEEIMALSGSFGFVCQPGDFQIVCFLEKIRMNSDAVEFSWETNSIAYAKFATIGVIQ